MCCARSRSLCMYEWGERASVYVCAFCTYIRRRRHTHIYIHFTLARALSLSPSTSRHSVLCRGKPLWMLRQQLNGYQAKRCEWLWFAFFFRSLYYSIYQLRAFLALLAIPYGSCVVVFFFFTRMLLYHRFYSRLIINEFCSKMMIRLFFFFLFFSAQIHIDKERVREREKETKMGKKKTLEKIIRLGKRN